MNNWQSLLFYLASFLLSTLLVAVGDVKKRKLLTVLGLMIPILIAGLRYKVGTDYGTYLEYVRDIAWHGAFSIDVYLKTFSSYIEPTFYLLASIVIALNMHQVIFIIYGTISIVCIYRAVKKLDVAHWPLAYCLLLIILFPMSFNLMRQFAAIAIAVYATATLLKGEIKKFFGLTILAMLFHTSAIVNIISYIVYVVAYRKIIPFSPKQKIVVSIVAGIGVAAIAWYGLHRYGYLFQHTKPTTNLNFIPRVIMLLIVLSLCLKAPLVWRQNISLIILSVVSLSFGLTGFFVRYGDRISLYFFPFILILLPTAIYQIMPQRRKYLTIPVVMTVGILYFVASYYILGSHQIIPYRTILS